PCRRGEYAKVQYHPCELLDEQLVRQIAANWMHRLPRRFAARIQAHWKRQTRPRVRLNPKIAAIWIKEPFPKSLSVLSFVCRSCPVRGYIVRMGVIITVMFMRMNMRAMVVMRCCIGTRKQHPYFFCI